MKNFNNKWLLIGGVTLLTTFTLVAGLYYLSKTWAYTPARSDLSAKSINILVEQDKSFCSALSAEKLTNSFLKCFFFSTFLWNEKIEAGTYTVRSNWTPMEMFAYVSNKMNALKSNGKPNLIFEKWYVDFVGPSESYTLISKLRKSFTAEYLEKEWRQKDGGSEIVHNGAYRPNQKIVNFLNENAVSRVKHFKKTDDPVTLLRIWIKPSKDSSSYTASFSAFRASTSCVGEAKSQKICKNWRRLQRPKQVTFLNDKVEKGVLLNVLSYPFGNQKI